MEGESSSPADKTEDTHDRSGLELINIENFAFETVDGVTELMEDTEHSRNHCM